MPPAITRPQRAATPCHETVGATRTVAVTGYLAIGARYPRLVLTLVALVTVMAGSRLGDLELDLSARQMMLEDDLRLHYEACRSTFGGGDGLLLFFSDDRLLTPDKLQAVREALSSIEALPGVAGTLSLFSLNHVWVDASEQVHSAPYLARPPRTPAEASAWVKEALRNPLVAGNLLSRDGRSMAVSVRLREDDAGPRADRDLVAAVDGILASLKPQIDTAFQIGPPAVRQALSDKIAADQRLLLPAAVGLLLVVLGLTLRWPSAALIPFVTASVSVVWTLGLMAHLGIPVNVLTAIVPALLVVVGSTEDIHLLAEYHAGRAAGDTPDTALERMVRYMGLAVLLTFVTTAFGFASIAANPIPLMREFGLVAAAGLSFNFIATSLVIPAWLRLAGHRGRSPRPAREVHPFRATALWLLRLALRRRRGLWVLILLVAAGLGAGTARIHVDSDPLDYFALDDEIVERLSTLRRELTGVYEFSIVLDAEIEGTFARVRYLDEVARLQKRLDAVGQFRKSLSFADVVGLMNAVMDGPVGAAPHLPDRDGLVREYLLFLDREDIAEFVSDDLSQTRILVRHDIGSSHALAQILSDLQTQMDAELPRGIRAYITGEVVLTGHAADHLAKGQALSLGLVLLAIWSLVSLVFVDVRAGLIAVVPNLLPIAILFGALGWLGIALDTGTAMVAAIALGICVDNTTHFMLRYHQRSRSRRAPVRALEDTVRQEATPIFSTSLALGAGFALLGLSSFPPVAVFGLLSAMVVVAALFATFVITPSLLASVHLVSLWDLLDLSLRRRVQQDCRLFRGMRPWQIKKLILLAEVRDLLAGDTLFRAGERGDELYVVLDGELELWGGRDGPFRALARRGPGETLGEGALLEAGPRTESATALVGSRVLVLRWDGMRRIVHRFPRVGARLFRNLSLILGAPSRATGAA